MFKALSMVLVLALAVNAQQQQSRLRKLSAYQSYQQQQQDNQLQPELGQFKPQFQQQQQQQEQQQILPKMQNFMQQQQLPQTGAIQQPQLFGGDKQQTDMSLIKSIGSGVSQQQIIGGQEQQQPQLMQQQPQDVQLQQPIMGGDRQYQSYQQQPEQKKIIKTEVIVDQYQAYQQQPQQQHRQRVVLPTKPAVEQYQSYQQQQQQLLPTQPQFQQQRFVKDNNNIASLTTNPCIGREAGEKFPYLESTRRFIVCLEEGQYVIMQCAPTTFFNIHSLKCENTMKVPKACASNPCQNGGRCTDLPLFKFKCDCLPGTAGDFCDKTDACLGANNQCGVDSICVPLPFGSLVPKYYILEDGNKIGLDCAQNVERNPCLDNTLDIWNVNTKLNVKSAYIHCEGHIPFFKLCQEQLELNVELQRCDWPQSELLPTGSFDNSFGQQQQYGGYGQQIITPPTQPQYGSYGQKTIITPTPVQPQYGSYGQQVIPKPPTVVITQQQPQYGGYQQQQNILPPTLPRQSGGYGGATIIPKQTNNYGSFIQPPTEKRY